MVGFFYIFRYSIKIRNSITSMLPELTFGKEMASK